MPEPNIRLHLPGTTFLELREQSKTEVGNAGGAAEQFEALLIAQMLASARRASGGGAWLGSDGDDDSPILEFAEQQIASVLSSSRGFGLANLIEQGLRSQARETEDLPRSDGPDQTQRRIVSPVAIPPQADSPIGTQGEGPSSSSWAQASSKAPATDSTSASGSSD